MNHYPNATGVSQYWNTYENPFGIPGTCQTGPALCCGYAQYRVQNALIVDPLPVSCYTPDYTQPSNNFMLQARARSPHVLAEQTQRTDSVCASQGRARRSMRSCCSASMLCRGIAAAPSHHAVFPVATTSDGHHAPAEPPAQHVDSTTGRQGRSRWCAGGSAGHATEPADRAVHHQWTKPFSSVNEVCAEQGECGATNGLRTIVWGASGEPLPAGRGEPEPELPALGGRRQLPGRAAQRCHHEPQQRAAAGRVRGAAHQPRHLLLRPSLRALVSGHQQHNARRGPGCSDPGCPCTPLQGSAAWMPDVLPQHQARTDRATSTCHVQEVEWRRLWQLISHKLLQKVLQGGTSHRILHSSTA